ncbi:hydroxyacid dehydrogenase [Marivita hallyeonensis]|uniref:(S)-sulfolactate dehydrogenase n=1 Tax=Marivita hallyeonensis TaxID=996342 RepID=A0A1M5N1J1_9RHOB|nr:hydroxyacid dehydrogenase [Marivita hallyeonensis]SHG83436.1 (S)-sulfolactate dehydrogenase [Marivita hallyeonensis]
MADVVIPEFMDEPTAQSLIAAFDVHWDRTLWSRRAELLERVRNARALIVRNDTLVNTELLDAAPRLQVVARMGVGLDTIDVEACAAHGVEVVPSIGANAVSVAEYVIATAMILLRGPAYYATSDVAGGIWDRPRFAGGREIAGRTMGIVGFGSIGQTVGDKARAMGMDVIAYDAVMPDTAAAWSKARRVDLETLLAQSDVISLHCPKLPQTIDLIDADAFAQMKSGAVLINSARGGIVNEAACAAALKSGQISGAALDTLDVEPIDATAQAIFRDVPNLILSPHIAGVTQEANRRIAEVAADTVRRVLGAAQPIPA